MRRIDGLFLKYPFYGSRQMVRQLRREGTPAEAYYEAGRPVDMMYKARALPTSPQAQHQQQDVINMDLAA